MKRIGAADPKDPVLQEAGALIRRGELVAFPTETVYGLGGNGLNPEAARKIYEAKGRPSDNPLILHVAEEAQIPELVREYPPRARALAQAFWPGPLTMILPKSSRVPRESTGGLDTVALRMPSHEGARAFLKAAALPVAAPSANRSGRPSPTEAAAVWEDMQGRIPLILDGGPCEIGLESTIVDLSVPVPTLLRPGFYGLKALEEVLGLVAVDPALFRELEEGEAPKAPGMKYRHYAPQVPLTLVEGQDAPRAAYIMGQAAAGPRTAALVHQENLSLYREAPQLLLIPLGSRSDSRETARRLFSLLRSLDKLALDQVFCESFPEGELGEAVMNRLSRAAGGRIINI